MIKFIKKYYGSILFIFAIVIVSFVLYGVFLEPYAIRLLEDRIIFGVQNLSAEDLKYLNKMIVLKKVHTGDFVLERIIGFYQTLLATVIGIAALGSFVGFLYIRNSHKRDICDEIEKEISSDSTKKIIETEINKILNAEDLKVKVDNIAELEDRLEQVEKIANILSEQIDRIRQNREKQIKEKITFQASVR
ncbi:MAG: hypothetical protein WCG23_10870 [bacterium]